VQAESEPWEPFNLAPAPTLTISDVDPDAQGRQDQDPLGRYANPTCNKSPGFWN